MSELNEQQETVEQETVEQEEQGDDNQQEETNDEVEPAFDFPDYKFVPLKKKLKSMLDLSGFLESELYADMLGFLTGLSRSVKGKKLSDGSNIDSDAITGMLALLDRFAEIADSVEPIPQESRFGNKAYRDWHDAASAEVHDLLKSFVGHIDGSWIELGGYLMASFGEYQRMDYGTGHETSFFHCLYCLFKLGMIRSEEEMQGMVLRVFARYIDVCHMLQLRYNLEPCGSHGVWSLDDFQFLVFLFGSSQLIGFEDEIPPDSVLDEKVVNAYCDEFMYMDAVKFVRTVKFAASFQETSPVLTSIATSVPHWSKANGGFFKMYEGEITSKFPIMQHMLFGSIINYTPPKVTAEEIGAYSRGKDGGFGFPGQKRDGGHTTDTSHSFSSIGKAPWAKK